jgi:hypothetical protein
MTDLTLTQDANMTELALVPNDPAFADQEIAFVESLNQTCDNVSLWSESGSAGWRDFWEHCPFTLIRENGRAQDRGFSVTGTMLTAVLGSTLQQSLRCVELLHQGGRTDFARKWSPRRSLGNT